MAKEGKATCQRITADLCSLATALETGLLAGRGEKNARGKTLPSVTASHALTRAEGHAVYEPHPLPCQPSRPLTPTLQARLVPDNPTSATDHRSVWKPKLLFGRALPCLPRLPKAEHFFIAPSLCFLFSILASDLDAEPPPPPAKVCLLTKLSRQILVLVVLHYVHSYNLDLI